MILSFLFACANEDTTSATGDSLRWESDAGIYALTLVFADGEPRAGPVEIAVSAEGVTALTFDAVMSTMGHGLVEEPVVTGTDGAWTLACVFPMSGTWTLSFGLDGRAGADTLSGDVEVH
jgi:hypothetical protein